MSDVTTETQVVEYGCVKRLWNWFWIRTWHWRLKRWIPRLVWLGDELDVRITFTQDRLCPTTDTAVAFRQFSSGAVREIEKQLSRMGIGFDSGMGCEGRDWEWDWSLSGPVRVIFRGRSKNPELRVAPPEPIKLKLLHGGRID